MDVGEADNKPFDPIRAPIVKRMFELADEDWSIRDICKWSIEQGFTMPPRRARRTQEEILTDEEDANDDGRNKIETLPRFTTIQAILKNKFFAGYVKGNDSEWIRSTSHETLVPEELFNSVQLKLSKRNKSKHYNKPLEYPFRNLFRCNECKRSFTPTPKKGILYIGCRCITNCPNKKKNLSESKMYEIVTPLIQKLNYTNSELRQLEENAHKDIRRIEQVRLKNIESMENKKKKLREDLEYLRSERPTLLRTKVYTPEDLNNEINSKEKEIKTLISNETISEEAITQTVNEVIKVSELLKNLTLYWDFAKTYEKEEILKIIFSELFISEKPIEYKLNSDFEWLKPRFVHTGARERT